MKDYIELTKPRVTWLILLSTAVGFYFGSQQGWSWIAAVRSLVGTGLIASGTFALNQWWERETDSRMRRTARRPLPEGRILPGRALAFGVAISLAGLAELWWGANPLAACLGAATLLSYLFAYTPLKRRTSLSTVVGAFPGAMPPLIGFAAASGVLTLEAWVLFLILFLWQFPHFLAIAWMYRDDYARAGILMLPVEHPDGQATARQMIFYSLALIPVSMIPSLLGMSGKVYLSGALLLGVLYLYSGVRAAVERTILRARSVLVASILYLPLIYGLMLLDRTGL